MTLEELVSILLIFVLIILAVYPIWFYIDMKRTSKALLDAYKNNKQRYIK